MNRAVIFDRDGTLVKDMHYLSDADKVQIYRGVIPALRQLRKHGWKLIVGTNQSGVARGYLTLKDLKEIHARMLSLLRKGGVRIDGIYFCPHHPDDGCMCRKPQPGMLTLAAKKFRLDLKKSVVVGDKTSDVVWGRRAGSRTVLVLTGYGREHRAKPKCKPDFVAKSLPYAVKWILKNEN